MSGRLPQRAGEWIDRSKPVEFRFEGQAFRGFSGDTISTALWASGVRLLGRSFKYHRPRGIFSLANHDVSVLVEGGGRTNIRADIEPIAPGMDVKAVNTSGGLWSDRLRFTETFSKFMPVGFYYKAFHRPRWLFPIAERAMRRVAGLGKISPSSVFGHSPKRYDFCDVLVVGTGPAGLSAAVAAAEQGLDVLLVDEQPRIGGSLLYQHVGAGRELMEKVAALPNVRVLTGTTATGYYADHWVALVDSRKLTKLRAGAVVVATGVHEQPSVFHGNDIPGVMLGSAAQRLIHLYAVQPMRRGVVLACGADGYRVALDLHGAGVEVAALADLRVGGEPGDIGKRVLEAGIPVHRGHCVYEAHRAGDKPSLGAVVLAKLNEQNEPDAQRTVKIDCDGLAVSVGYAPAGALLYQAGAKFGYESAVEQLIPRTLPSGVFAAGRVNGVYAPEEKIADGRRAGLEAAKFLGKEVADPARWNRRASEGDLEGGTSGGPTHPYPVYAHRQGKNFIDLDEDLHLADFVNAHQEGFDNIELMKRYSTVGMGASQGKHANMLAVRVLAKLNGATVDQTGTTTSRPFYHPVPLGHLAGRRFHPLRRTPMHALHERAGAHFMHVGAWLRPEYYQVGHQSREESIFAEAKNVRDHVGLIDVGTLGKIQVCGPEAAAFLERLYTGRFTTQKVGLGRYALALDESGVVIDDGLVGRFAEDMFYVTTTTSASDAMYREMQRWALIWKMKVLLANATGRLTAVNLVGPASRSVLAGLTDIDLTPASFPYLAVRRGMVCGVAARVMRVGFVGELGYEIHFRADAGVHVWRALIDAGRRAGIRPFGVEAQRLLRLEKGHLIVSQDTDALTNPIEAGLEFALGKGKDFYVGQRSLEILRKQELMRKLVGFTLPADFKGPWPEECHLVIENGRIAGRVTSFARRSNVGQPIGLAFVTPDRAAPGTRFSIRVEGGKMIEATVAKLPFYDPQGVRQKP